MRTTARTSIITTLVLALAAAAHAAPTAEPPTPSGTAPPSAKAEKPTLAAEPTPQGRIDPKAIDSLKRMGAYLREQDHFTVTTKSETDYVLDDGQKATLQAKGELHVQRPDKLHAYVNSDRKQRQYFYDGKTFTVFSPNLGLYSTVAAPATLRETADSLMTQYGLQLPMVDLFRWGTSESDFDEITDAKFIGTAKIDGVDVDQFALRQPGLDWQIWIQRGDHPLPRKLLLTTTDDPARPQYDLDLAWDTEAKQPENAFTFVAPKNASKIAMADADTIRKQEQKTEQARRTTRGDAQ